MKKKNPITITLILIVAVTTLAFGSQLQIAKNLFGFESQANAQLPSHILYDRFFRMTASLKRKSETQGADNEKTLGTKNYFKKRANIDDAQDQILQNLAHEYIRELTPIENQAKAIIAQKRREFPNGVVPRDQPPPPALVNLQEQRNALALQFRDRLKESLGAEGFDKFDTFINGNFASHIRVVPLSEINFDQAQ
jgi:hypothetical protein